MKWICGARNGSASSHALTNRGFRAPVDRAVAWRDFADATVDRELEEQYPSGNRQT